MLSCCATKKFLLLFAEYSEVILRGIVFAILYGNVKTEHQQYNPLYSSRLSRLSKYLRRQSQDALKEGIRQFLVSE